ncbi:MAG: adenylosuccinate lyase [Lentisphaerae bacterium]|nr:adenylosuccinate lyase [Lentisphaerota bacterium]
MSDAQDTLLNITPLDGRYAARLAPLTTIFSEFGLIRRRFEVEVAWLIALCDEPGIPEAVPLTADETAWLNGLAQGFSLDDARRVKAIEATTNHDVKAVEYALREKLAGTPLANRAGFIHFACTSEDINNLAHALMLRDGLAVLRDARRDLLGALASLAWSLGNLPMLARTHGQAATPTTLGKEFAVFAHRLGRIDRQIDAVELPAKLNGAVGNYNAHVVAYPEVHWEALARRVIEERFGLRQNPLTTQIESHDGMAELFDALCRWNTVLLSLDRDVWSYISAGYLAQQAVAGEVGSSTMPHKINPIDFENSEGNLGLANALLGHLARKLPVSRLQRDLTDSTVIRSVGAAFGHTLLAMLATRKGLGKLHADHERLAGDLDQAWEVLAEPVQTVMRKAGLPNPYEQLKAMTRGQAITADTLRAFIAQLDLPAADKRRLLALTPASYIGLAPQLARRVRRPS